MEAMQENMDAEAKDCIPLWLNNWLGGEYREDNKFQPGPRKHNWILMALLTKTASAAAVDPWHLKKKVAEEGFPKCSCVINGTCQCLMLIK